MAINQCKIKGQIVMQKYKWSYDQIKIVIIKSCYENNHGQSAMQNILIKRPYMK